MDWLYFFLVAGARALRRDWRSGELRLLALVIAVAAVSSVAFLAKRVEHALDRDASQMLGGDLVLGSGQPLPPDFAREAARLGLAMATTMEFPSMLMQDEDSQLVAVKAVSGDYPLRGKVRLQDVEAGRGGRAVDGGPPSGELWVDPQLLGLLALTPGDTVMLGESRFLLAAGLAHEPDRSLRFVNVAPRVLMNLDDLAATGLLGPGARVRHQLLLAGEPSAVSAFERWVAPQLASGQQLQTLENSRPELQNTLDRGRQFLSLVALLTVMLAGVAVALAARRHYLRQGDGMAVLRCLGASRGRLGAMVLGEGVLLAMLASVLGLMLAGGIQAGLSTLVHHWLDVSLPAPGWLPVLQGLATGLLLLLGFAMVPLLALRRVAPLRVFHRDAASLAGQRRQTLLAGFLAGLALLLVVAGDLRLGLVLAGGFLLAIAVFAVAAAALLGVAALARRQVQRHALLRLTLAGLARRRSLTVVQVCALSLGLAILLLLALTRNDLLRGWQATIPPDAPNAFLINVQDDQREDLAAILQARGLGDPVLMPMVRARLLTINERPVSADDYEDERARSMVNRDFNLSWRDDLPASNRLARGRWLDPAAAEASIESGMARTLGLAVGDHLRFEIAGRIHDVEIVGLRDVKWDSFEVNFFALLSESVLRDAPGTWLTSLRLPEDSASLQRELLARFPNVTVFDIDTILAQVQAVLDQVILAVQLLFLFTVAAGLVVLSTAFLASRDERMHEIALLRTLGASARQLRRSLDLELLLLGLLSGLLAAGAAIALAQLLAGQVFDFEFDLPWWPWPLAGLAGMGLAVLGGRIALAGILATPPISSLRQLA
ncbi:MAG: FtsX-like permease family protein [Castellaniella sp.]